MIETLTNRIAPARRIDKVGEYYFSVKLAQIRKMEEEGASIINLGIGSPDMPAPGAAVEELTSTLDSNGAHRYQPYRGTDRLRNSMAQWYNRFFGVELDPGSQVLPLMGSKEGIMHICMAFLNRGEGVLIPDPGYPTYEAASNLCGARPVHYDLIEENDWFPDLDSLERHDLDGVKIMWVNYPHMPTGKIANYDELSRLVDFALSHNILIVNDNPYSFILNDSPLSILEVPGAMDCAMELNSLSKSHNMAGWRVGMLAGNSEFINWTLRVKSNMDSGMFLPVQMAASKALEADDEWYRTLNNEYRKRRNTVYRILEKLGCSFSKNQAGLFVWAAIGSGWSSSVEMSDWLLEKHGLFLTPGTVFGSNGFKYIRISLCVSQKNLEVALSRLS